MTDQQVVCPICGKADEITKVSTIYLTGIGLRKSISMDDQPGSQPDIGQKVAARPGLGSYSHSRRFAPPSSGRQLPTRPIHPDMVVLAFSAVAPFFLYGILTSQVGMLLPVLVFLAGFYALYFWQRKQVIRKFQNEQAKRRAANDRINRCIDRWMRLYYCAREDGIFEPGSNQVTPIDQMMGYLLREE